MRRDAAYPGELTPQIAENASKLLAAVNTLLRCAAEDGIEPALDEITGNAVASGWRPQAVNERTSNAGKASTHLTGRGIDIQDHQDRRLARWCLRNLDRLETLGLYMEAPRWTGGKSPWIHLQCIAPASGKRVFIPSSSPPLAIALPEEALS
jgi:hypothetical protein